MLEALSWEPLSRAPLPIPRLLSLQPRVGLVSGAQPGQVSLPPHSFWDRAAAARLAKLDAQRQSLQVKTAKPGSIRSLKASLRHTALPISTPPKSHDPISRTSGAESEPILNESSDRFVPPILCVLGVGPVRPTQAWLCLPFGPAGLGRPTLVPPRSTVHIYYVSEQSFSIRVLWKLVSCHLLGCIDVR